MDIQAYANQVLSIYAQGNATEHSYRAALQGLFNSIQPEQVTAQNEPKRLTDVGAPDFSFHLADKTGGQVTIGHCEAKDLGHDLKKLKGREKEQFDRYAKALPNLIYTNCFDFMFYREGQLLHSVSIGENIMGWQLKPENYDALIHALQDFASQQLQTITNATMLAEKMAGKAALIKDIMGNTLVADQVDHHEGAQKTELLNQYDAFSQHLIQDISLPEFADIYAETIAYGMFAARLNDPVVQTFSRQEALEHLPKSNPFLRKLFGFLAGQDLDERLRWVIDDLAKIFLACDLSALMHSFGKMTERNDPFIHFYEDFLSAYNPKKRKARGVWYTPEPVVNFIVRAVDQVLQTDFGLSEGLADTSKVSIDLETGQTDKKGKRTTVKKDVHRVQILDPATGTGTFLAEAIKQIAPKIKNVAPAMWSSYVENDLIPRVHGFELLMASYAMCHMKLDMLLTELGYEPDALNPKRLSVYLTNSLEEGQAADQSLPFASWLSTEAKEANEIKRDKPIMCIIGNPPYSVSSSNKSKWINDLVGTYKKNLNERNIQPLSDDYIKFIRFSHHLIVKNGEGVLGFVTNNGFLDGLIHRQMRKSLMEDFDKIYILDLHGNSKKQEVTPDGGKDVNVFDIMQGVSIIIAVKTPAGDNKTPAAILHQDLWGTRAGKYEALRTSSVKAKFKVLKASAPNHYFVPKDFSKQNAYKKGFGITEFMEVNSSGIKTHRDHLVIDMDPEVLSKRINKMYDQSFSDAEIAADLNLKSTSSWSLTEARKTAKSESDRINLVAYRPFDLRYVYYSGDLIDRPRSTQMRHMIAGKNIGLAFNRQIETNRQFTDILIIQNLFDLHGLSLKEGNAFSPLYLYPDEQDLDQSRRVNFDQKLWKKLQDTAEHSTHGRPDEIETFDYIYGVLHCPAYRETYKEFLKIDFPRIPWPKTPDEFWTVSDVGTKLRQLHLMEAAAVGATPYPFMGQGDGVVEKPEFKDGKVWINKTQYFDSVPPVSWAFFIGGYQPAQKWLKDRKGRELSFDDVKHYQKIVAVLNQTDALMQTIQMDLT